MTFFVNEQGLLIAIFLIFIVNLLIQKTYQHNLPIKVGPNIIMTKRMKMQMLERKDGKIAPLPWSRTGT